MFACLWRLGDSGSTVSISGGDGSELSETFIFLSNLGIILSKNIYCDLQNTFRTVALKDNK